MKDFDEILAKIHQVKESKPALSGLTSDSRVSVWGNMAWIIAYAINLLREMFEVHKSELEDLLITQKRHRAEDVRRRLLNFQYGFPLRPETDEFINGTASEDDIEASKIIKYAAVTESTNEKRVICKIATESAGGELEPIEAEEMDALAEYINRIKPAGVPYTVLNLPPDRLQLGVRIFRDPLLLDSNGVHRISGKEVVKDALKEFLKEMPFNGELRLQDLANKLEQTDGVNLVQIDYALSSWLDPEEEGYGDFVAIDVRKIPQSGYFKIANADGEEDFSGISYVV